MYAPEKNNQDEQEEYSNDNENQPYAESKQEYRPMKKYNTSAGSIEDIQFAIQEITKKIEHEKINHRICNERYEKKFIIYSELQGRPVPLSNEEKEKQRRENQVNKKKHKVSDPIVRKKLKEQLHQEKQQKALKEISKNTSELETWTNEINEVVLKNLDWKNEIEDLRKQRMNALTQRNEVMEKNKQKEEEVESWRSSNNVLASQIKYKELAKSTNAGKTQENDFVESRKDWENEYHKIIQEFIRREREHKKEQSKKRQILSMIYDKRGGFKGGNSNDLEKQVRLMAEEEISDRTPIIEKLWEKWKYINHAKKHMIIEYSKNSEKISKCFERLMKYLDVEKYENLPIIFRKSIDQLSNIQVYISQLTDDINKLENKKQTLTEKINYLTNKAQMTEQEKNDFIENKQKTIENLKNNIKALNDDITTKRDLFTKIQTGTDRFLLKLNNTYLAEYIPNKIQIDSTLPYNEVNIKQFISNVEDYYKLIQMFELAMNEKDLSYGDRENEKIRNEIRMKLENFTSKKVITDNLYDLIKMDSKNGLNFEDIIKKSSEFVVGNMYLPEAMTNMK